MLRFMITAPASGSGKTVLTCGMLAMLKKKGLDPCSFKCGPDYIDPMFHRSVLGCECHNLDLFLSDENYVKTSFYEHSKGHGAAVVEGVMGYYDGLGAKTTKASSYDLSRVLDIPAILILNAKGASMSLAAVIRGMKELRDDSRIAGVILNNCAKMQYLATKEALEEEAGVPLIGYLPPMEEAVFGSRHLGLFTAGEINDLSGKLDKIADALLESIDFEKLCEIAEAPAGNDPTFSDSNGFYPTKSDEEENVPTNSDLLENDPTNSDSNGADPTKTDEKENYPTNSDLLENDQKDPGTGDRVKIAVARDDAFCFIYQETLEAFEKAGAEIAFFSPITDTSLPEGSKAVYIPGGYPEIYADKLEANKEMKEEIVNAIKSGMPFLAECGGFLYLGEKLQGEDGKLYEMTGALKGEALKKDRLVRFGYAEMTALSDDLLMDEGDKLHVHEFHYWDTDNNGTACELKRPLGEKIWPAVHGGPTLFAGFPHLYLAASPKAAERFIRAAKEYK